MHKCMNCKYFNPTNDECDNETIDYIFDDVEDCEDFTVRKKCEYRFEHCVNTECMNLCHSLPSERGCYFNYCCKLDDCLCDENCKPHELRHELEHEKENLHKMFDTERFIEKMIEETKLKIEKLENEVKNNG